MSAGVAPDASNTSGSAEAGTGLRISVKPKAAIASKSEYLIRRAEMGFEVSNGGVVPRRLVVELFIDCVDCIVLVSIVLVSFEVGLLLFINQMNENPFCSRQRKNLRPDHGWIGGVGSTFSLAAGTNATLRTLIEMG